MAAIIKSISFQNFYNYYGSYHDNTYNFTEGLNFINADNNGGKTKFFCGLLWMFMDKTYDMDTMERVEVSNQYNLMLSKKADKEHAGQLVTMGVQLTFEDTENALYSFSKQVEFSADRKNHKVSFTGKKTINGIDTLFISETERYQALEMLIPQALNRYALLQGEKMDKLLDVTSSRDFANTIRSLSGIREIETLSANASKWHKSSEALLNEKEQALANTNAETERLLKHQSGLKANIDKLETEIERKKSEKANAIIAKDNLEAFISSAKERTKLKEQYTQTDKELSRKQKDLNNFDNEIVSKLLANYNPWLFYGISKEKETFQQMRDSHFIEVKNASGLSDVLLPADSPDQPSLKRMLKEKKCEVCGRPFEEHSSEWMHILKLINRSEEEQSTRNDFLGLVDSVRSSVENVGTNEERIKEGIRETKLKFKTLLTEIKDLKVKRDQILDQFQNAGGNIDDVKSEHSDSSRIKEYTHALQTISDADNYIREHSPELERRKSDYETISRKISESPEAADTKPYRDFDNDIEAVYEILIEARENIYNDIINSIESASNDNFHLLTKNNAVGGGNIRITKLDDKNIQVTVKSVDGTDEMTGLGTGFQRMKQLAILMAIIQTQISGTKYDAPLIADAPFSEFSRNFINNFIEETPKVFKQEIILTKDTVDTVEDTGEVILNELGNEIKERIVNQSLKGTFYLNQPVQVEDQTNQRTIIKQFN